MAGEQEQAEEAHQDGDQHILFWLCIILCMWLLNAATRMRPPRLVAVLIRIVVFVAYVQWREQQQEDEREQQHQACDHMCASAHLHLHARKMTGHRFFYSHKTQLIVVSPFWCSSFRRRHLNGDDDRVVEARRRPQQQEDAREEQRREDRQHHHFLLYFFYLMLLL